jgi:hypothetical protein
MEQRRGADQGIDGRLYFHDEGRRGQTKQIILSVKSGHVTPDDIRNLRGVVARERAAIGVLLSFQDPTRTMRSEAASAGFYESPSSRQRFPRIQILTIAELLEGKSIQYPMALNVTFPTAPRARSRKPDNFEMLL